MSLPAIFAVVPTRNEASRYLQSCLTDLTSYCDGVIIADDDSEDDTVNVACDVFSAYKGISAVYPKPTKIPGLMEHEGQFRKWVLETAVGAFEPRSLIDWLLVIDADEFLRPIEPDLHVETVLRNRIDSLHKSFMGIEMGRDELWQLDPPVARNDKLWGTITNIRMFRYDAGREIAPYQTQLACGSVPPWATWSAYRTGTLRVVHAGYADPLDRSDKHKRYDGLSGHHPDHIASILDYNVTARRCPHATNIWRGVRDV